MPNRTKILAAADLHLGRYPSRVPVGEAELSVASVWQRIVRRAIDGGAGLVLLAGDVIDQSNRFFEAIGPLARGLEELAAEGIHTCAVSGNHDWDALPEVVDVVGTEFFHLLGRGGAWERWEWPENGAGKVVVAGWSFPNEVVRESPLAAGMAIDDATIGLLHCDVGVADSRYAPVSEAELAAADVRCWVLGHIHQSRVWRAGAGHACYPGSPQALDPGERGAHGIYWIDPAAWGEPEFEAVASVRYESVEIDAGQWDDQDGEANAEGVRGWLLRGVQGEVAERVAGHAGLRELVCRVAVTGRTAAHGALREALAGIVEELALPIGERAQLRVERVRVATRPKVDLAKLAANRDPVGVTASALIDLENGATVSPVLEALHEATEAALRRLDGGSPYAGLRERLPTDPATWREEMMQTGWALLESLLDQKAGAGR